VTRRLASWLAVAALGLSMLVFAAVDEGPPLSNADRAYSLAQDFACPVCQGQSVAESDVVVARNIRREIRVWVDEGRSDAFIATNSSTPSAKTSTTRPPPKASLLSCGSFQSWAGR